MIISGRDMPYYWYIDAFYRSVSIPPILHFHVRHVFFRYYEDLQSSGVDEILQKRLSNGEMVTLSTGKLMERLLTIKMIREGIGQRGRCDQKGTENEHPTKAAFINRLIPQAQERLKSIR